MNRQVAPIKDCMCPISDHIRIVKTRLKMMSEGVIDDTNHERLFKDYVRMETRRRLTCTCPIDDWTGR